MAKLKDAEVAAMIKDLPLPKNILKTIHEDAMAVGVTNEKCRMSLTV